MNQPSTKCLNPDCNEQAYVRGLCGRCYAAALYIVRTKQTTWEELEKNNKVLKRKLQKAGKIKGWLMDKSKQELRP